MKLNSRSNDCVVCTEWNVLVHNRMYVVKMDNNFTLLFEFSRQKMVKIVAVYFEFFGPQIQI